MKILSKEEFGYVVDSIKPYVDQVGGELLAKALIGGTTSKVINLRTGIKGKQALNLLNSNIVVQDGVCGWDPASGTTTTFTQHTIETCAKKYNEALCYQDLYDTYQSMLMKPGQIQDSVPFEEQIMDLKVKQIAQYVEKEIWTGTTGSTCFEGFKSLISTGSTFSTGIAVSASGTTFSPSADYGQNGNPLTEVDKLINALDDDALVREDLVVFMSYSNFRLYVQALTRANFFQNYIGSTDVTSLMEAIHPNTNVRIYPTIGLFGSNQLTIGPAEYMVQGVDLTSDAEKLVSWYSLDFDEVRFRANFNLGVTIATFGSTKYFATNNLA
jgi:hypothetical protein